MIKMIKVNILIISLLYLQNLFYENDLLIINIKAPDTSKEDEKTTQAQQKHDWWRGEQLKQRELFLSRQVETLAATHIRGKCTVTLYNETESLDSYLEREVSVKIDIL